MTPGALTFGALAIATAALVGGMSGFATALLSTPALLLAGFDVALVVVVNLTLGVVTRTAVAVRDRSLVRFRQVALPIAGSAPGAVLGALTVGLLAPEALRLGAGTIVTLLGLHLLLPARYGRSPGRFEHVVTGLASGYLSTSTSLNGPPVAALLARCGLTTRAFIANLACYFVFINLLSLAVLGITGFPPTRELWPALPVLLLAGLAGNSVGVHISTGIPARVFTKIVAVLVIASGLATTFT